MQSRLLKELHFLLLPVLAMVVLPFGIGAIFRDDGVMLTALAFGSALVGGSVFGREFSHRTMEQLLAQPLGRFRIWGEKMLVLAIALAPCLGLTIVLAIQSADRGNDVMLAALMSVFIPLCAICTTPYLTLVSRSTMGAVVFSFAIPMGIVVICSAVAHTLEQSGLLTLESIERFFPREQAFIPLAFPSLSIYCAIFGWLGYRKFKNFEVIEALPAEIPLANHLEAPFRWLFAKLFSGRAGVMRSLIAKELRLQHMTFVFTAVLWTLLALATVYIKFMHPPGGEVFWFVPLVLHVAIIPVVVGGLSVAEERNLGLHGWHLTLPVSARKQWLLKLAVCLPLSFLLGGLLPYYGFHLCHELAGDIIPEPGNLRFWPAVFACEVQLFVTVIAIYGSSISNNTLRAIVLTIITAAVSCLAVAGLGRALDANSGLLSLDLAPLAESRRVLILGVIFGAIVISLLAAAVAILVCAFGNFRRVDFERRRLWQHGLIVLSPVVLISWLTTLLVSMLIHLE